ncbi:MAG: hypothetical protein GY696_25880, partial [Gammaproteobacteria bacterium]|nr:hypothetical protein [Gammaproteobacteria bacterium]
MISALTVNFQSWCDQTEGDTEHHLTGKGMDNSSSPQGVIDILTNDISGVAMHIPYLHEAARQYSMIVSGQSTTSTSEATRFHENTAPIMHNPDVQMKEPKTPLVPLSIDNAMDTTLGRDIQKPGASTNPDVEEASP